MTDYSCEVVASFREGRTLIIKQVNFVNICFNLRFLIIMANVSSVKSFLHVYALNEFVIIMRLCMWWYLIRIVSRAEATEVISNYSWSKKKKIVLLKQFLSPRKCLERVFVCISAVLVLKGNGQLEKT